MALELSQFDVMAYLWETLEKTPDGEHIQYTVSDIDMLWNMGFVDTERVPLETWRAVFESHRQPNGIFLIGHEAFLDLDQYRYKGEIHIPFDAMLINEGRYTDTGLQELIDLSIAPSCSLPPHNLDAFFATLKKDFRDALNLVLIDNEAKQRIKKLLEDHASPLRNLELLFDQMIAAGMQQETDQEVAGAVQRATDRETSRQASRFIAKPADRAEAAARQFKAMAQAKTKAAPTVKSEGTELRKIKRSRKGVRG